MPRVFSSSMTVGATVAIAFALVVLVAGDLSATAVVSTVAEEQQGWLVCGLCAVAFGGTAFCCLEELLLFLRSPAGELAVLGCASECAFLLGD